MTEFPKEEILALRLRKYIIERACLTKLTQLMTLIWREFYDCPSRSRNSKQNL